MRDQGLLDPETTRWVDDISYCNRLADGSEGPHLDPDPPGLLRRLLGGKAEPPQVSIDRPADRGWGRGLRPVINVSWKQVAAYAQWLSEQTGKYYRLPSEAEWEYAARAGTSTPFWWGESINTDLANYDGNYSYDGGPEGEYRRQTMPVDRFDPNPWGLYQVHGNVWEWVQDCWNDSYDGAPDDGSAWEQGDCGRRLLRGGSWFNNPGGGAPQTAAGSSLAAGTGMLAFVWPRTFHCSPGVAHMSKDGRY